MESKRPTFTLFVYDRYVRNVTNKKMSKFSRGCRRCISDVSRLCYVLYLFLPLLKTGLTGPVSLMSASKCVVYHDSEVNQSRF